MRKTLAILRSVITWIVLAAAVSMMIFTIVSVSTFDRMDRGIFGYKMFIVLSDSMKATDFAAGDLVISKEVDDPSTLKEGDIITFQSINPESYGEIITHKIRRLTTDESGMPGFITYGTTTDTDDETVVTYNFVIGKYQFRLPGVGKFFQFLQTTPGYIICILIPFLTLILLQGFNSIRLFRRYKGEQMQALNAEKAQIEAERQESQKMMQELLALRAQLGGQLPVQPPVPTPTVPEQAPNTPEVPETGPEPVETAETPPEKAENCPEKSKNSPEKVGDETKP